MQVELQEQVEASGLSNLEVPGPSDIAGQGPSFEEPELDEGPDDAGAELERQVVQAVRRRGRGRRVGGGEDGILCDGFAGTPVGGEPSQLVPGERDGVLEGGIFLHAVQVREIEDPVEREEEHAMEVSGPGRRREFPAQLERAERAAGPSEEPGQLAGHAYDVEEEEVELVGVGTGGVEVVELGILPCPAFPEGAEGGAVEVSGGGSTQWGVAESPEEGSRLDEVWCRSRVVGGQGTHAERSGGFPVTIEELMCLVGGESTQLDLGGVVVGGHSPGDERPEFTGVFPGSPAHLLEDVVDAGREVRSGRWVRHWLSGWPMSLEEKPGVRV